MFRKAVAASVVAAWLLLLGIDFSGDTGFIQYSGTEIDQSVDGVLADLGEAVKIFADSQGAISPALSMQLSALYLDLGQSLCLESVSLYRLTKDLTFTEDRFRLHKLYRVFLI